MHLIENDFLQCFISNPLLCLSTIRQGRSANPLELSPLNGKLKNAVRAREFPIGSIHFMQELGEGAFGKVYKGELVGLNGDVAVTQVCSLVFETAVFSSD